MKEFFARKIWSRKLLVSLASAGAAAATGNIPEAVAIIVAYVLGQSVADAAAPILTEVLNRKKLNRIL